MSDTEHILLHSGRTTDETAARLADALHAQVIRHEDGAISVRRPLASDPGQTVGGQVRVNDFGEKDPAPGDETIYDHYDTVFELWTSTSGEDEVLHEEARQIFDEIVARLPWPVVHTRVAGSLFSASMPGRRRTDFPPGTSYDAGSRRVWEPYAHPE